MIDAVLGRRSLLPIRRVAGARDALSRPEPPFWYTSLSTKTFNQILYEGPGFPDEAEVVEILAADAREISAGQVLLVLR